MSANATILDELAVAITRHSQEVWTYTEVPRLSFISADAMVVGAELLYEPMICFAALGAKRATAGDRTWVTGRGQMFLNSLELPVTATLEQTPYRSVVLHLDPSVLSGLLLELGGDDLPGDTSTIPSPGGQVGGPISPEIADALLRWVRLLDTPQDIGPLAGRTEAEILYRLLRGPLGPVLRQFAIAGSSLSRIRATAAWIHEHYDQPLRVEDMAASAHVSVATLHRQFKAATGMTPIRFQKYLRLQEARRLMLAGGASAAQIARRIGYATPSQFNREYRSVYGLPPVQDVVQLRERLEHA